MRGALTFIAVLSVLVVIHEYGHYLMARLAGIRVDKFSIGFGPVLFGRKFGDTEFAFSLLPFGGYVKLAGESPEEAKGKPDEFQSKSSLQKLAVVVAGPLMNALLAFVLFTSVFLIGEPVLTTRIGKVLENTPASMAGLKEGDVIRAVDGQLVSDWEELLERIRATEGRLSLTVVRGDEPMRIAITPKSQEAKDALGKGRRVPFIGVAPSAEIAHIPHDPLTAARMGAERLWTMTSMIFASIGMMITGSMPFKESVTGPIGIYYMTQQAAEMGWAYLLYFTGSLSVSLFVLNLLPVPVLDGGHVLFILIEKIKGGPLREAVKERMTQVGMGLILILMMFVIFQDIRRFAVLDNLRSGVESGLAHLKGRQP
ncbi:MAG: Metalloprotease MmpA [Candidatus Omnitrophica bacterium]|nr:Metalloprotease MmpA [Candidatus Omnitrophota bacterium]